MVANQSSEIWPKAIIATFILFACFIGYMVVKSFSYDVNMVKKDYYQDEVKYQSHLENSKRGDHLGDSFQITFNENNQQLTLQLPSNFDKQKIEGSLILFRPSDRKLDRKVILNLGDNNTQTIYTSALKKGYWQAKLDFTYNGEGYFKKLEFKR